MSETGGFEIYISGRLFFLTEPLEDSEDKTAIYEKNNTAFRLEILQNTNSLALHYSFADFHRRKGLQDSVIIG